MTIYVTTSEKQYKILMNILKSNGFKPGSFSYNLVYTDRFHCLKVENGMFFKCDYQDGALPAEVLIEGHLKDKGLSAAHNSKLHVAVTLQDKANWQSIAILSGYGSLTKWVRDLCNAECDRMTPEITINNDK